MLAMTLLLPAGNVFAAEFENPDDMTMQYLEDELKAHLEENHPEIAFGTMEFNEYLMGVLLEDADEELAELPNYEQIQYYGGEYMYQLQKAQVIMDIPEEFVTPAEFRAKTIGEIKEEVRLKDLEDARIYQEAQSVRTARASSFDIEAAADYALRYAHSPNPAYKLYASDCTNFVSQIVHTGGRAMKSPSNPPEGIKSTTDYWYHITEQEIHGSGSYLSRFISSSWVNVDDFYEYMTRRSGAWAANANSVEDLIRRARKGDVVQLRKPNGDWYHSIFVSGTNENGDKVYCGHSRNAKEDPLNTLPTQDVFRILSFD